MGYQVFPQPSQASSITNYSYVSSTTAGLTISSSNFSGYNIYASTTQVGPGVYTVGAMTTTAASATYVIYGSTDATSFRLTPSTIAVSLAVASTSSTSLYVKTRWRNTNGGGLSFRVSTGRVTFVKKFEDDVVIVGCKTSVAGSNQEPITISTDGRNFTRNYMGFATNGGFWGMNAFKKDGIYYVWTTAGNLHSSTDFVNWTTVTAWSQPASPTNYASLIWDSTLNRYFATADANVTTVWTSTNLTNWTSRGIAAQSISEVKRVNNYIYGFGRDNLTTRPALIMTTDGLNWTTAVINNLYFGQTAGGTPTVEDINYGNNIYFIAGKNGSNEGWVSASTDGVNWTTVTTPTLSTTALEYSATLYDGQYMMVLGVGSTAQGVLWSTNGFNWSTMGRGIRAWGIGTESAAWNNNTIKWAFFSTSATDTKYWALAGGNKNSGFDNFVSQDYGYGWAKTRMGENQPGDFNLIITKSDLTVDGR